jgi:hypothetical protein
LARNWRKNLSIKEGPIIGAFSFWLKYKKRTGGGKMINVLFYNNDLQIQFNDYEELKTYLESIEGQGLTIKGIDHIKQEQ